MSKCYTKELRTGQQAIQAASLLTKQILNAHAPSLKSKTGSSGIIPTVDKPDQSPVTIADFAAQALIISIIHRAFPDDTFLGEESAEALRRPGNEGLLEKVWEGFSSFVSAELILSEEDKRAKEKEEEATISREVMLDMIDLGGKGSGGSKGRVWVLDPVDGTATFIRGQQYAVCLALLEDGIQKVAVLGCPNLGCPLGGGGAAGHAVQVREDVVDRDGFGVMISAVKGQGANVEPIVAGRARNERHLPRALPIVVASVSGDVGDEENPTGLRFVDCDAITSSDYDKHAVVAARLGAAWPPESDIWSSQMKYIALAVGACNTLIKIPRKKSYRSNTWDHAGGMLIAAEVGYTITDLHGQLVNCGLGRTLADTYGLVVAPLKVHSHILDVTREVARENGML